MRYSARWSWPESTQVQSKRLREFLADLSALTRKYGLAVDGAEGSAYLCAVPDSVIQTLTNPENGETQTYTWDEAPMPDIAWHPDTRCYLTTSELAQWEAIRSRSAAIYGPEDGADQENG